MELMTSYSNARLRRMIKNGESRNLEENKNQIKEMLQELILYSLAQSDFFDKAAFLGGTALRIFYDLDRFSEDLDFSLIVPDPNFNLDPYIKIIKEQLASFGISVQVSEKKKKKLTAIKSGMVKAGAKEQILSFFPDQKEISAVPPGELLKIKFEIDTNPPANPGYEFKQEYLPGVYSVRLYDLPSLFSGKIHAILCRPWTEFSKGRDLYDYFFYMQINTPVNLSFLQSALVQTGAFPPSSTLTIEWVKNALKDKFHSIDFDAAKNDVLPFLDEPESMNFWDPEIFCSITDRLKEFKPSE